jgi:predicted P-loop ATPase/GTPase
MSFSIENVRILVSGTRERDSGKTTVASELLTLLAENGIIACGFKPRAGNSIWYNFKVVYESFSQGRCYGKDATLLKRYSGVNLSEEVINPIHRLWAEPPSSLGHLKLPAFICDRVRTPDGASLFIVNKTLPFVHGAEKLLEDIKNKVYISNLSEFNELILHLYDQSTHEAHKIIAKAADSIIYESYSDIALPWNGIKELDMVFVVEPGSIFLYDPQKYLTAVKILNGREKSTKDVVELLKPVETVKLPPATPDGVRNMVGEAVYKLLMRVPKTL